MTLIESARDMQGQAQAWRRAGRRIALVPTMGALHDGHLSLVRIARAMADSPIGKGPAS